MASYADVVESVDRRQAGRPASSAARTTARTRSTCLLQVSLDPPGAERRSGADPDDLDALAAAVDERRDARGCAA